MFHPGFPGRQAQRIGRDLEFAFDLPGADGIDLGLQLSLFFDECIHLIVGEFFTKAGADPLEFIEQRFGFAEPLLNIRAHIGVVIKLRFLRQVTDLKVLLRDGFAFDLGIDSSHDPEQSGLTRTV